MVSSDFDFGDDDSVGERLIVTAYNQGLSVKQLVELLGVHKKMLVVVDDEARLCGSKKSIIDDIMDGTD